MLITRLSDLSVVELGEVFYDDNEDPRENDGQLKWSDPHGGDCLPVGTSKSCDSHELAHVYSCNLKMKIFFVPETGEVVLWFEERSDEHGAADGWKVVGLDGDLAYLELHCPWPEAG